MVYVDDEPWTALWHLGRRGALPLKGWRAAAAAACLVLVQLDNSQFIGT
jgi:hypothetical protein